MDGGNEGFGGRSYAAVFKSRQPQRVPPGGKVDPDATLIGPGTYAPGLTYALSNKTWQPWMIDPMRQNVSFSSKTQKDPVRRPLTADIDIDRGDCPVGAFDHMRSSPGACPG